MIHVFDPDPSQRDVVAAEAPSGAEVSHEGELEAARALIARGPRTGETVVIGPHVPVERALEIGHELSDAGMGVVLLAGQVTRELLQQAMRAGLADVLGQDRRPGELREAIERARSRTVTVVELPQPPHGAVAGEGRVSTVFSTKGGCGKSLISSNLAVLLAQQGRSVALVDLDLQSGDLAIMMQLLPSWSIHDAAERGEALDQEAIKTLLAEHRSGVHLLAAPTDPALAESVSAASVHRIIKLLRTMYEHVVIDSPAFFSDPVLAALDDSDDVVLVGSLDVPSVKNLKLAMQTLDALGFHRSRIRVVMNRADSNVGLRVTEVERSLGTRVDFAVPSSREVPLSVNQGVPLASLRKRSTVVAAIAELARAVGGGASEAVTEGVDPAGRRWFTKGS